MGDKFLFTAGEICSIIKTCGEAQVSELSLNGFCVRFHRPVELKPVQSIEPRWSMTETGPSPAPAPTMAVPNHEEQTRDAILADEVRLREEQINELTLTDPYLAEKHITEGVLKHDGTRAEDDEEA